MKKFICFLFLIVAIDTMAFANEVNNRSSFAKNASLQACVKGDNLYVAFADNNGYEICYWFCPTMANKLFTFHSVGYRKTKAFSPSVEGIATDSKMTWLNSATSDNIGAIYMKKGGWLGGNHLVDNIRTAVTKSVKIMADDYALTESNGRVNCHQVTVVVENDILDPSSAVTASGTYSKKMLTETVHYKITENTIEVTLYHSFAKGVANTINRYYGMQSMFRGEDKIMTPRGPYTDFTIKDKVNSFNNTYYPKFDRFIEMNSANGWCQASHLLADGIGDHRYVGNKNNFITTEYNKNYHVLIMNMPVNEGTSYMWRGVYSWFRPLVNNKKVLVYASVLNGKKVLYIDAKRACNTTFTLPENWVGKGKKVQIAKTDKGLKLSVDSRSRVRVTATQAASGILECD